MQTLCKEASIIAVERVIRVTEENPESKKEEGVEEEKKEENGNKESSDELEIDMNQFYIEVSDF